MSDSKELVVVTHRRSGIRFWKVVKRKKFLEAIYSMGVQMRDIPTMIRETVDWIKTEPFKLQ